MSKRLIVSALIFGVLATVLCARIDDAMGVAGRIVVSPQEIAADAESVTLRWRGISSLRISLWQVGSEIASPSAVLKRASAATWSTDPLASMGVANWEGLVHHKTFFWQGWPLKAFSASFPPQGGCEDFLIVGAEGSGRVIALSPVWSGLLGNTLLFASVFWLALSAMSFIRRTLRRRAGLCARCCYTKRGIPAGAPCPECGHS